jgi:hypothetical protein
MQTIKKRIALHMILSGYRDLFGLVKETIQLNKSLFTGYLLIATLCCMVFTATSFSKATEGFLSSSTSTPWGTITSVFVHSGGINHLTFNLIGLLFCFAFFTITNVDFKNNRRIISPKSFFLLIFVCAFTAGFLLLILRPDSVTSGLSGVVYAAEGVVLALSLVNSLSPPRIARQVKPEQKRPFLIWLINLFTFASILLYLICSPALFLGEALNVNVFVHGVSFLEAFFATLPYIYIRK